MYPLTLRYFGTEELRVIAAKRLTAANDSKLEGSQRQHEALRVEVDDVILDSPLLIGLAVNFFGLLLNFLEYRKGPLLCLIDNQ